MVNLTIITPCIRYFNLKKISKSIPRGVRWIVVFDMAELPPKKYIPVRAECYTCNTPTRGYPQSNFGIDKVDTGWVYFLDDDTYLHPDFMQWVIDYIKRDKKVDFIHFNQSYTNGTKRIGGVVKVGKIDKGSFLVKRDLIGEDRFKNCASADGMFAEVLHKKAKAPVYLDTNLSYYNALRVVDRDKYTIIIPTMWYHTDSLLKMVEKYENAKFVTEVLIVNNREEGRIPLPFSKVRIIGDGKNMYVNPAWNLAVTHSKSNKVVLANDDIYIHEDLDEFFAVVDPYVVKGVAIGPASCCIPRYKRPNSNRVLVQDGGIKMQAGSGIFAIMTKSSYHQIPDELPIWHGDLIFYEINKYKVFKGITIETNMRGTTTKIMDAETAKAHLEEEREFYLRYRANGFTRPKLRSEDVHNVVLVLKSGGEYLLRDVFLLADQIKRKRGILDFVVYCITDLVKEEMAMKGVHLLPMEYNYPGWWAKMNLFAPEYAYLKPFLYIDLDTAILKKMETILPRKEYQRGFIMLRDFYRPTRPASGVMWLPRNNKKLNTIWAKWMANPVRRMTKFRGDQNFIEYCTMPDYFFQDIQTGVVSFKPLRRHRTMLDGTENVVCFHGTPKVREATNVHWVNDYVNLAL